MEVEKTIDYVVGPNEMVLGNVKMKVKEEDATVVRFEFFMKGHAIDFVQFAEFVENVVFKCLGDNKVYWMRKEFEHDADWSSWNAVEKVSAVYHISVSKREEVIARAKRIF